MFTSKCCCLSLHNVGFLHFLVLPSLQNADFSIQIFITHFNPLMPLSMTRLNPLSHISPPFPSLSPISLLSPSFLPFCLHSRLNFASLFHLISLSPSNALPFSAFFLILLAKTQFPMVLVPFYPPYKAYFPL